MGYSCIYVEFQKITMSLQLYNTMTSTMFRVYYQVMFYLHQQHFQNHGIRRHILFNDQVFIDTTLNVTNNGHQANLILRTLQTCVENPISIPT
jgi:hypothetical protein